MEDVAKRKEEKLSASAGKKQQRKKQKQKKEEGNEAMRQRQNLHSLDPKHLLNTFPFHIHTMQGEKKKATPF